MSACSFPYRQIGGGGGGNYQLDLEFLKPLRVAAVASDRQERQTLCGTVWLECAYCMHHPVLQYLTTKLAE
jgi:hypothetical protein